MAILLALDIATRAGWACGDPLNPRLPVRTNLEAAAGMPCPKPPSGVWQGPRGDTTDVLIAWRRWLRETIQDRAVSAITFEAPVLARTTSLLTARRLYSMAEMVPLVAREYKIGWVCEEQNGTIKEFWAGNGKAKKTAMLDSCRARSWEIDDHNEADALALWSLIASQIQAKGAWVRPTNAA